MPVIIGCTKENNCKKLAFLKAKMLEQARAAGLLYFTLNLFWQIFVFDQPLEVFVRIVLWTN